MTFGTNEWHLMGPEKLTSLAFSPWRIYTSSYQGLKDLITKWLEEPDDYDFTFYHNEDINKIRINKQI